MSKKDKIRTQDIRNQSANGYIRIKIINNGINSGYTSMRLTVTNGGSDFFDGCLSFNYKSKVIKNHIAIKPYGSKCYYDQASESIYILPSLSAYTGVLEVLGLSNFISDVECEIVKDLDVSFFEEISLE